MTEPVTVVYIDGSCLSNGDPEHASAGYGVHFPGTTVTDLSGPLPAQLPHTNQSAELYSACQALEEGLKLKVRHLQIRSDSMYVVRGSTLWMKRWRKNGWLTNRKKPISNMLLWKRLDRLLSDSAEAGVCVTFQHVRGHAGEAGNLQADRLAKDGAVQAATQVCRTEEEREPNGCSEPCCLSIDVQ